MNTIVTNINAWYENNFNADDFNDVKDCICSNCDYCAEPHQLYEQDLIDSIEYQRTINALEAQFDIQIQDDSVREFIKDILVEVFNEDQDAFLI